MIDKPPKASQNMISHKSVMDALIEGDDNIVYLQTYLVFENNKRNIFSVRIKQNPFKLNQSIKRNKNPRRHMLE
jgi:hypothetical protein